MHALGGLGRIKSGPVRTYLGGQFSSVQFVFVFEFAVPSAYLHPYCSALSSLLGRDETRSSLRLRLV